LVGLVSVVLVVDTFDVPVGFTVVSEECKVVVERLEVAEVALLVVEGVVVDVVVAADRRVTSRRRLELPLGTVPLAPPWASPFEAVTLMASPTPLIDIVTQYLPWLSVVEVLDSMGDCTVTYAPYMGAPLSLYTKPNTVKGRPGARAE